MPMKIESIWEELETDNSFCRGLLLKRLSSKVKPEVYVALKAPERLRCIAIRLHLNESLNMASNINIREIQIETFMDSNNQESNFLLVLLINAEHRDIFSVLCEDLISAVRDTTDEGILIGQLLFRLEKWQMLFERLSQQGLSESAQIGLYGELHFLMNLLHHSDNLEYCVNSWKGPELAVQDFQFADQAVEVKATHGKNHQKIHIANERQLDIAIVPHIFIYHVSLDVRRNLGENLNQIVSRLRDHLTANPIASDSFRLKLLEAGYFDVHEHLYLETGYSIRQLNIYKVTDTFPKITESGVPAGVGDVSYSIIVGSAESWSINEEELFGNLINC